MTTLTQKQPPPQVPENNDARRPRRRPQVEVDPKHPYKDREDFHDQ